MNKVVQTFRRQQSVTKHSGEYNQYRYNNHAPCYSRWINSILFNIDNLCFTRSGRKRSTV